MPDLAPDVATVVHGALEPDRERRFQDMRQLLATVFESSVYAHNPAGLAPRVRFKGSVPNLADVTGKFFLPSAPPITPVPPASASIEPPSMARTVSGGPARNSVDRSARAASGTHRSGSASRWRLDTRVLVLGDLARGIAGIVGVLALGRTPSKGADHLPGSHGVEISGASGRGAPCP